MANSMVTLNDQLRGLTSLPLERQVGLLLAAAAAITLMVSVVLWLTRPSYMVLYPSLSDHESGQVVEALARHGVPYRLEPASGAVQVPGAQLHEARLKLATEGLPKTAGFGFELLEQDQGLGTSRMIQDARQHRALEGELARSITTLESVESARVHLALPRQSVFVRDRVRPSASVLINLYAGRTLDEGRIAGIVHLVSASIPELDPEHVTVVDQRGRLLTQPSGGLNGLAASGQQLDFTRRLEESYARRVLEIISPIVGLDAIRAQVVADVDFARIERTTEAYDPEATTVRSEQISEDSSFRGGPGGVPGALTNQPPEAGVIVDPLNPVDPLDPLAQDGQGTPTSISRRTVRNFEVDRTISHIREAPGGLRRLSVAVVLDHQEQMNADGVLERLPLDEATMERITTLVREAVGFNGERGDSVNVINASFRAVEAPMPLPEPPLWEAPWVMDLAKTVLAAILVLIVALTVVRPLLRSLAAGGRTARRNQAAALAAPGGEAGTMQIGHDGRVPALAGPGGGARNYEDSLDTARDMVREDPKRVAQLMKTWIASDGATG